MSDSAPDRLPQPALVTVVTKFRGPHRLFSNMFRAPVAWGDDVTAPRLWACNELPYVLAKTRSLEERAQGLAVFERAEVRDPEKAGMAVRHWGKRLVLRPDWDALKREVMLALVRDKFARNRALGEALLSTGDGLIEEGNTWGDIYWGIARRSVPERGIRVGDGENHLGRIMMQVRAELRRGERHLALPL